MDREELCLFQGLGQDTCVTAGFYKVYNKSQSGFSRWLDECLDKYSLNVSIDRTVINNYISVIKVFVESNVIISSK